MRHADRSLRRLNELILQFSEGLFRRTRAGYRARFGFVAKKGRHVQSCAARLKHMNDNASERVMAFCSVQLCDTYRFPNCGLPVSGLAKGLR
jgi:hypothetical protein